MGEIYLAMSNIIRTFVMSVDNIRDRQTSGGVRSVDSRAPYKKIYPQVLNKFCIYKINLYLYSMRLKDSIHTKTLTAKLTLPQLNKIIVICHEFMRNNIGVNHSINNTLSSKVVNGKVTHNVCGEYNYDDVEITIYTKNNTTLKDFVSTFIHEYTHYILPQSSHNYGKLYKKWGYDNHPHERMCKSNEDLFTGDCLSYIRKVL